ncbi:MAG TPA: hypothetical protein VMB52_05260 [Verrucomicrobiae bacterium]|nr:hypothetical protein [Verrucomicrobiae bacterium]
MNEIERKFLVAKLPDVPILKRYTSERYLLQSDKETEIRITHSGDKYFYEQKRVVSDTERTRDKYVISEEEFNELKAAAYGKLVRETLLLNENPKVVVQVYKGEYEGLMRAETEFQDRVAADQYVPDTWMGREITGSSIARDSSLGRMTRDEVLAQIKG